MSQPNPPLFPPDLSRESAVRRGFFLLHMAYFAFWTAVIFVIIRYLLTPTLPFLLGFAVAALLQKPKRWLAKKTILSPRMTAAILVLLLVLLLGVLFAVAGRQLYRGLVSFFSEENAAAWQAAVTDLLQKLKAWLSHISPALSDRINASLSGLIGTAADTLRELLPTITPTLLSTTAKLPSLLFSLLAWILSTLFLTADFETVTGFLGRQIPSRHRPLLQELRHVFGAVLPKMGRAYLLLTAVTFGELWLGLWLLRIPHAFLPAAVIAVIDLLPILGTGTVLLPWAVGTAIVGEWGTAVGLGLLYAIITVVRHVLEPRLISRQLGLHPAVTLFFMLLGLRVVGVAGILLFPLAVIVAKQLHDAGYIRLWK